MLEFCVHLEVEPDEGSDGPTTRNGLLTETLEWLSQSLTKSGITTPPLRAGTIALDHDHELTITNSVIADQTLDQVIWTRPHEADPTLRWRTTIKMGRLSTGTIIIDLTVELSSTVFEARRLPFTQIRPPRLVREIASKHRCYGEAPGSLLLARRIEADEVAELLVPLIESPKRVYPLVVVAPTSGPRPGVPIPPYRIQEDLAGLARVFELSPDATFKLSESVGPRRSCFDGGIRVYWPGFTKESNPYLHPLFLGEDIEAHPNKSRERIFSAVRGNANFRWAESAELIRLQRQVWDEEERQRVLKFKELESRLAESSAAAERATAELTGKLRLELDKSKELSDFVHRLRHENETLRELLKQFAARTEELRKENESVKRAIRDISQVYVDQGKIEKPPESVHEAALRAQGRCLNLLITNGAIDVARRSDYSDPDKVYTILLIADEIAAKLAAGATFGRHWGEEIVRLASERGGLSTDFKAHLSMTAKGAKFRQEYEVSYLSGNRMVRRLIEPHILLQRKGNVQEAARIFLDWDSNLRKLVVSRIGEHPKNLTS